MRDTASPGTAHSAPTSGWSPGTRVGYDFARAIVDDHSHLAYVELHEDEKAATVTGFLIRALDWLVSQGIHPRRLMTDNAFTYIHERSMRELLAARDIKHLRTKPYRPQTEWEGGALTNLRGQDS